MARTDAELLAGGDAEDFGVFYDRHAAAIAAYVGRRGCSRPVGHCGPLVVLPQSTIMAKMLELFDVQLRALGLTITY